MNTGMTMSDYAGVFWHRRYIVLAVIIVTTAAAFLLAARQPKQYAAHATLIYQQDIDPSSTGQQDVNPNERNLELQSIADVIASPTIKKRATAVLKKDGMTSTDFTIGSSTNTNAANGIYRNTATIDSSSTNPALAAAAVNAYANVFVAWRKATVKTQLGESIAALQIIAKGYSKLARTSSDYLLLVDRTHSLEATKAAATGNFSVLSPATVPTSPFAPRPSRSAVLGFIVGLFVAIGLVIMLEQFDTRLRRPEEIAALFDTPILARVPKINVTELRESPLVCLTHPDGHVAEALRMLRTNLEFLSVDQDVRSLAMISGSRGEGKSITLANLAITLAAAGNRVVVVDGDLRGPQMHKHFGLDNSFGVSTVATGQTQLMEALQQFRPNAAETATMQTLSEPDGNDLPIPLSADIGATLDIRVLTSGPIPPNPSEIIGSQIFGKIISQLSRDADIVLVDSPALLVVSDTVALCSMVDGYVFLVDLNVSRSPQLRRAAERLTTIPSRLLGIVAARGREAGTGRYYKYMHGYSEYPKYGEQKRARWSWRSLKS